MIPILILAAGQSSRMGPRDKLLEDVGGVPLLRKQVETAHATGCPVFVALPPVNEARGAVIDDMDVTLLSVPEAAEGMSGTMRGAVAKLPECPAFMLVLADLVALDPDDLRGVLGARTAHPDHLIWRGATQDGKAGHPIVFDASLRPAFADLRGDGGGEAIVKPLQSRTYLHKLPGQKARLDLDTPQDWAQWRKSNR